VPQAGAVDSVLGLAGQAGDSAYRYVNGNWVSYSYLPGHGWLDADENPGLALNIGEGLFICKTSPTNWTRSFSVTY
jgi:hypothetical protein